MAPDVFWLRKFVDTAPLLEAISLIADEAPFRHVATPWGKPMSVTMTNAGRWAWHSDDQGYRYIDRHPETGRPWPPIPDALMAIARRASALAGFGVFEPDCCLINRYAIGAQMGSHRDHDELDFSQPIVSVSIGLPATFVWYGARRAGASIPVRLEDGDVLVWGRSARTGYHAVRRIQAPPSGDTDACRYNLTFRRAR